MACVKHSRWGIGPPGWAWLVSAITSVNADTLVPADRGDGVLELALRSGAAELAPYSEEMVQSKPPARLVKLTSPLARQLAG
jgi:hypothetical protein